MSGAAGGPGSGAAGGPGSGAAGGPGSGAAGGPGSRRVPLYARVLRLRHVELDSWQRAVFVEGSLALAVVLVLADLASAWTLLALPLAVAAVVKLHDVLTGAVLGGAPSRPGAPERVSRAARR